MPSLRPLYPTIRLAIVCLILAIGLRTWLVMGLIEPVTVAGSSMVPTLRGTFVTPQCPKCRHAFSVGAEFAASTESVACPQCANSDVPLNSLPWQQGDRLWVDRTSLLWRQPERWELIVARNPRNAAELCIKRIVGLPGEHVAIRDGNVLVDGAVVVKSPAEQHTLRQRVHRESLGSRRWQPEQDATWRWSENAWQKSAPSSDVTAWLSYRHPRAQPLTDDQTYNAGLSRRLNLVDEFMLSVELRVRGKGSLSLAIDDGTTTSQVEMQLPDGAMTVVESEHRSPTFQLSASAIQRLASGKVQLEFSNFDQQLLLVIDGQVELRHPWPNSKAVGTDRPVSIGACGLEVELKNLILYRDTYYSRHATGALPPQEEVWQLGVDEYFLLGDNAPVSLDSRLWGPVPARLLLGKLPYRGR